MDEEARREIGLFRYALIRPGADSALSKAQRGAMVRALACQEHLGVDGRAVRVSRSTLDEWIRAYRQGGFDALLPRPRVVAPRTSAEVLELAFQLKRERPERTAAQVRQIMLAAGGPVPGLRTLQTHLARAGLNVRADGRTADKVYGRFEAVLRNELWTGDGERHEALRNHAVMKGHRGQFVAADWSKLGAAYPPERAEWVASSPDNDGTGQYCQMVRVRLARREGVREKPAAERLSSEFHQLQSGGSGLGRSAHPHRLFGAGNSWVGIAVVGREATVKVCGVAVAMLQGQSWAPHPSNGSEVNVGTNLMAPLPDALQAFGGKARCRLMPSGWDGGPVVVRGRESRLHGEGVQQVRSLRAGRGDRL
ncbi:MAG: helix-turn-helix domain-containing protein [Solirubrobacteraceae bacterium]